MASIQEAIKRLSWIFTSSGADKVAADHNKVAESSDALAVKSQKTEKSALDLDKAFAGLERRFDTTIRAQQDYQKVQDKVNAAVAQNPQLQERANNVLALASEHFGKAKDSADAFSKTMDSARGAALGLAAGIGPIGAVLGSFGPWGIAAAAGIGLVVNAFNYLSEAANKAGDEASALKRFSDVSGLTTVQVRGVTEAGQELGVGADTISGALQKFTVNLDEARKGGGALFEQIQAIDAKLADDIASTRSSGEALDLLTQAYNRTTDATTKAALAKAAFGKGGQAVGPVLGVIAEGGGLEEYSKQASKDLGVTKEWTEEVARLRNANKDMADDLKTIESTFFSKELLERQNQVLKKQIEIAMAIRDTKAAYGESGDEFDVQRNTASQAFIKSAVSDDVLGNKFANALSLENTAAIEAETKATEALTAARIEAGRQENTAAKDSADTVALLGEAATGAELAAASFHKLTAAFLNNKFGAQDSAEAMEKYQRALNGGTGNAVSALQEQRTVIEAIGQAAKNDAQYWADYNAEMRKVGDETKAAAIASEKLANAQATAKASAKEQIQSMKDQNELAKARTVQEERNIAARQKYDEVLKATKDPLLAEESRLLVIEKYNIQIDTAARKRVSSYEAAANAAEQEVKAAQAAADAWEQTYTKMSGAGTSASQNGAGGSGDAAAFGFKSSEGYTSTSNFGVAIAQSYNLLKDKLIAPAQSFSEIADSALASQGLNAAINTLQGSNPHAGSPAQVAKTFGFLPFSAYGLPDIQSKAATPALSESEILGQVGTLYDLKNSQTSDDAAKISNLNEELAWLNTRPETIARDQRIVSLMQSIDQLKKATDSNTAAVEATLNPLYSQGHGALAIGYYKAAGGLDMIARGPTSGDTIPFHAMVNGGERIRITPDGQPANDTHAVQATPAVQNNYFDLRGMDTNNARRSRRQFAQGFGQTAAAMR